MATLRDIRRRIASVKNTQTITKAMQMVSAAKLRRAQESILKARPYAEKIKALVMELCRGMSPEDHPLFTTGGEKKRIGNIIITADKGLCGSFNNNIIFRVEKDIEKIKSSADHISLITVGKKGHDYFLKRRFEIKKKYAEERDRTNYELAVEVAKEGRDYFLSGEWNEIHLYYAAFKTVARYEITKEALLPIPTIEQASGAETPKDYLFEPNQKEILNKLLPKYLEVQILKAILESQTSEHAARMTAMDTASTNCKELIADMTLVYNKARQSAITKELLDIVGGAEALKK
ncbi:MAG: ATP synthase F1 subunit gamma [Pseudomonadota bacterium]